MITIPLEISGDDDDSETEERPCPDFYETCCSVISPTILISPPILEAGAQTKPKPKPIGKPDKCGVRNKNGAVFKVTDRDNEAQFGELKMTRKKPKRIYQHIYQY